jgi:chromosome segregation protein
LLRGHVFPVHYRAFEFEQREPVEMRLNKIKLAGFKSCRPDYCQPSQQSDWRGAQMAAQIEHHDAALVMGEIAICVVSPWPMSVQRLASRKPVGRASVELAFDNSDGTPSGQYAGLKVVEARGVA